MRHEVIVGVERRRRWSDDQKLSILTEVGVDGATVAEIARRHELTRQHIYQWRREFKRKGLWPCSGETVFLPLETPGTTEPRPCDGGTAVEIILRNGRILRCRGGVGDAEIVRLIRLVEAA
ncbi:MAG: transposase [Pseudomonadota bacterium]